MLNDLKQYITVNKALTHGGTAWCLKMMLERCKNEELVKEIIKGAKEGKREILDSEIYAFENLIADFHLSDALDISHDNVIMRMILQCYTNDFAIDDCSGDIFGMYFSLTPRGREISGRTEEKYIAEFVESEWLDLQNEFDCLSDEELIDIYKYGDTECEGDSYEAYSMVIVLDERDDYYYDLVYILDTMGFSEVVPGLLYFASYGYCGSYDGDITLDNGNMKSIVNNVLQLDQIRNIDDCDNLLCVFDDVINGVDDYLYLLMANKSSTREVLF